MTKFKKIIPALCMLLISAVLMGTSTYAWFSMNTSVKASGMKVTAESKETFLLISSTKTTADEIKQEGGTSVNFNMSDEQSKVKPAAHEDTATNTASTNKDAAWYYKVGTSYTDGTGTNKTALNIADIGGYVIHKTVYVTLANGSVVQDKLTVTAKILKNGADGTDITAAKVLVTSETGAAEFGSTDTTPKDIYTGDINSTSVITLDIWIYYDGNNTNVTSANFANLASASIELTFDVSKTAA